MIYIYNIYIYCIALQNQREKFHIYFKGPCMSHDHLDKLFDAIALWLRYSFIHIFMSYHSLLNHRHDAAICICYEI